MDTITESLTSVNEAYTKAVSALQSQVVAFHRDAAAAVAKASELPVVADASSRRSASTSSSAVRTTSRCSNSSRTSSSPSI